MSAIIDKLNHRIDAANSLLCVGLDSDFSRLSERFTHFEYPLFAFNRWIIEQTHPYVCAYKPNIAFYEARGDRGLSSLRMTMAYLQQHHSDIVTICDAKRADIGSTSAAYASALYDWYGFDAVTLNPYLGHDALQPFLDREDRASIILCRTSNAGAREFQDLQIGDQPLWAIVAQRVADEWNSAENCMLVAGATYPDELGRIRQIVGDMPLLVPGIGTQGGDVEQTVRAGLDSHGRGMVINASRSVIFSDKPGEVALMLRDSINQYR